MSKENEKPEKEHGIFLIEESRQFYRDGYRKLLRLLVISGSLNVGQLIISALVIYSALHVKPLIEAVNPSMQVLPVVPLSEPYVSNAGVSSWATQSLENTLDISFSQWQNNLNAASKYYLPSAFRQLIAGLKSSGILQKIVDQRLNTVLTPVSDAYVVKSGRINGIPAWIIKGKFQMTFQGATNDEGDQVMNAVIIVQRAPILEHPSGLVIRSIVLS